MRERGLVDIEQGKSKGIAPLVERMDPAIGEASTVMGAMMTELLRRSLRGGVTKIGEELEGYVAEKVDETIQERTPVLEQLAVEAADKTARVAATEVAVGEVRALEDRTREADQGLAGRIAEAEKKSQDATVETAQRLGGQIAETEKRVSDVFRSEMSEHVQRILDRARKGSLTLRARLKTLNLATTEIRQQIEHEQTEREVAHAGLLAELQQQAAALRHQLDEASMERRAGEGRLRQELDRLLETNQTLAARVAELEKPRGLRALWAWIRGWFRRWRPAATTD